MHVRAYRSVRACPVCGGHEAVALHEQRFVLPEDSPLPSAYTVASCERCGTCFADTPATQQAYDLHYERFSKYDDPDLGTGGGVSAEDRDRLRETAALLAAQPLPRGAESRVLDIGCAGGGLLVALAELGFRDLSGIDPSPACVARVQAHGFACRQARLSDRELATTGGHYDVVVLSHVLEHLVQVNAAMRGVRELLADGGLCYVEVPDASRYSVEEFVPFYFIDAEHINHFSRPILRNLASVNAFEVLCDGEKDLRVAGGKRYPAAWCVFRKGAVTRGIVPAPGLRAAFASYLDASARALDQRALGDLADSGCAVLLWGAGSHAQRMLETSPLAKCNLIGIVDRDPGKQGRALFGYRIREPETALKELAPDVVIVVASVLHGDQIAASIARGGLRNRVLVAR